MGSVVHGIIENVNLFVRIPCVWSLAFSILSFWYFWLVFSIFSFSYLDQLVVVVSVYSPVDILSKVGWDSTVQGLSSQLVHLSFFLIRSLGSWAAADKSFFLLVCCSPVLSGRDSSDWSAASCSVETDSSNWTWVGLYCRGREREQTVCAGLGQKGKFCKWKGVPKFGKVLELLYITLSKVWRFLDVFS